MCGRCASVPRASYRIHKINLIFGYDTSTIDGMQRCLAERICFFCQFFSLWWMVDGGWWICRSRLLFVDVGLALATGFARRLLHGLSSSCVLSRLNSNPHCLVCKFDAPRCFFFVSGWGESAPSEFERFREFADSRARRQVRVREMRCGSCSA